MSPLRRKRSPAPARMPGPAPVPAPLPVAHRPAGGADTTPTLRGPVESMLRHPVLTVLPVIVLVGLAAAIGLSRAPIYTAQSRVNVGRSDVPAYTLQGVTIGNATLATSYARFVEAPSVINAAARAAGVSANRASQHLSGTPIPESTLIAVYGRGRSSREARALSIGAATGLIYYVQQVGRSDRTPKDLAPYRAALREVSRLQKQEERLKKQPVFRRTGPRAKAVRRRAARLDVAVQAARLRAQAISNRFLASDASDAPESVLQLVVPATTAKSDAETVLERVLLVGLAAGLVLGVGLALLISNWALIRRSRR